MTGFEVGVNDLLAMKDVADGLCDVASTLSAEQAVSLLDAARRAHKALGDAIAFLESRAISQIEQPILVGSTAWSVKPTFKRRPNQPVIRKLVIDFAVGKSVNMETGDMDPWVAAAVATEAMEALYVSPSTAPKVAGVEALGATMDDVVREEHTGQELKKVEL